MSKLKLVITKNPLKLLEEIALREVKYGVPVSDGKKVAQLICLPEKFKGKKTEKAGVVVEEEHLLSFIDVCDDNVILDTGASMMYMQVDIQ